MPLRKHLRRLFALIGRQLLEFLFGHRDRFFNLGLCLLHLYLTDFRVRAPLIVDQPKDAIILLPLIVDHRNVSRAGLRIDSCMFAVEIDHRGGRW
jgi:hypothetical protein